MNRKQEMNNAAFDYLEANHSPSEVSECQAAMNIAVWKAYLAAVEWADKTMLDKICNWLKNNTDITPTGISNLRKFLEYD